MSTASHLAASKKAAAQTAVAAKPVAAPAKPSSAPGAGIDDGALRTPSWTAIVEAYHREGNGDREMLLALLHAKAKEDERLAALDLLRAEQLRAYTTHIAVHGPLLYAGAATSSTSSPTAMNGAGIPPLGAQNTFAHPHHHHHHAHPHHAQAHHHVPARAHAASTSAGSTASTSSSSSASTSRGRKNNNNNKDTDNNSSQTQRDNASRSPSLSHTVESRLSSPESIARTPVDERRLSDFALAASAISEREKKNDGAHLIVPSLNAAGKRKAGSMMDVDGEAADLVSSETMTISARPAKRSSPSIRSSLPSISTSLPTPTEEEQRMHKRTSSSPSEVSKLAQAQRSSSPRSLQQILNSELRPLSMSSFKVATSDVRSSASDEDDELAD